MVAVLLPASPNRFAGLIGYITNTLQPTSTIASIHTDLSRKSGATLQRSVWSRNCRLGLPVSDSVHLATALELGDRPDWRTDWRTDALR